MKSFILVVGLFIIECSTIGAIYSNVTENVIKNKYDWTEGDGMWSSLLEEWTLGTNRKGRIMMLPPTANYYVAQDRNDDVMESKISGSKIVTNNNNSNKKPIGGQVSETDLYLLSAIEKLVYKVDFMEKRLRRVEEMLYYNMAGNRIDTEPCPDNFTRVGSDCYYFGSDAGREYDWKVASKQCKKLGGFLAETENAEKMKELAAFIISKSHLSGKDYWLGGLNPGLLFIWGNSAKPVIESGNRQTDMTIHGDGRCLKLAFNPPLRTYTYKGADCSRRYSFICELTQNTSSNELKDLGSKRNILIDEQF